MPNSLHNKFLSIMQQEARCPEPPRDGSCWPWPRSLNGRYGVVNFEGRAYLAHRLSFEIFNGPIPKGKQIRSTCRFPGCVNPEHLTLCKGKKIWSFGEAKVSKSVYQRGLTTINKRIQDERRFDKEREEIKKVIKNKIRRGGDY